MYVHTHTRTYILGSGLKYRLQKCKNNIATNTL